MDHCARATPGKQVHLRMVGHAGLDITRRTPRCSSAGRGVTFLRGSSERGRTRGRTRGRGDIIIAGVTGTGSGPALAGAPRHPPPPTPLSVLVAFEEGSSDAMDMMSLGMSTDIEVIGETTSVSGEILGDALAGAPTESGRGLLGESIGESDVAALGETTSGILRELLEEIATGVHRDALAESDGLFFGEIDLVKVFKRCVGEGKSESGEAREVGEVGEGREAGEVGEAGEIVGAGGEALSEAFCDCA